MLWQCVKLVYFFENKVRGQKQPREAAKCRNSVTNVNNLYKVNIANIRNRITGARKVQVNIGHHFPSS